MTFGEKLKEARKQAGLSQEQLAEKLNVSRSAVAKWETDKGMPDVNNLKVISRLPGVSVDHLLDDGEQLSFSETREAIDLDEYEKTGRCRDRKDAVCLAKNEGATAIYALLRTKKLNAWEHIIDFIAGAGVVDVLDAVNDFASCYLIEKNGRQYLVRIDKEFITTAELAATVDPKKFVMGSNLYRGSYRLV